MLAREGDGGYIRPYNDMREGRGGPLLGGEGGPMAPMMGGVMGRGGMDGPGMGMDPSIMGGAGDEILILRKENNMLRMEIEELRKKNEGMLATNRFLLEENATIRQV